MVWFFRVFVVFLCLFIVNDAYAVIQEDEGKINFLIADYDESRELIIAVVEFDLSPGWHIYSSDPGDLGLPTKFSWPRYVSKASIHWPRFKDDIMQIGAEHYKSHIYGDVVVFPVEIYLTRADRGASFKVGTVIDYAACSDVCVPRNVYIEADVDVLNLPNDDVLGLYNEWLKR